MNSHRCSRTLFLLFLALVLLTACSTHNGDLNGSSGNVRVVLTAAAPTGTATAVGSAATSTATGMTGTSGTTMGGDGDLLSRLEHVNVTFSSMLARNLDGDLIDLTIDLPQTVDLISLMNGQQVTLPTGTLPPGIYDQLVVVIKYVEFVFINGGKIALTPPGGGWTKIVPVTPFEVVEGQTITIELRFKPWHAFEEFDGEFQFFPDFDCDRRD